MRPPIHNTRQEIFELNRFQQREIERQEALRRRLGLATDIPLRLGLAVSGGVASEEQLRRNHYVLQIADRISLALCCSEMPFDTIGGVTPRVGAGPGEHPILPERTDVGARRALAVRRDVDFADGGAIARSVQRRLRAWRPSGTRLPPLRCKACLSRFTNDDALRAVRRVLQRRRRRSRPPGLNLLAASTRSY